MKYVFERITDCIYYLRTPYEGQEAGITLIRGDTAEDCILIDSGVDEKVVAECLIPALRGVELSLKGIGYITVTHAHTDNIGGLSAIRREAPDIRVAVPKWMRERIQNPMYRIMKERDIFPLHNPVFREVKGVFVSEEVVPYGRLKSLQMIPAPGHDDDCVCWFHEESGTLIAGDTFQGNGNSMQGMPFYKNVHDYLSTIDKLKSLPVNILISSHTMDGINAVEYGREKYIDALNRCAECVRDTESAVADILKSGVTDVAEIAGMIAQKEFEKPPKALCYAMHTVTAHLNAMPSE